MLKQNPTFLDLYAIFLKVLSVGSVVVGLIAIGILLYLWGQLTAFYGVLRTALTAMGATSPQLAQALQLPDLPAWPLILLILFVLSLMTIGALTFWAIGSYINLKLALAEEERESRKMQRKAIEGVLQTLKVPSRS